MLTYLTDDLAYVLKLWQVPQLKSKSLIVSLVPVDVGKPTVRLSKSPIVEGTCTWENPVYETVKLIKEVKSGRIREKFYYVIVSTVSDTLLHLHSRLQFKISVLKWQFL